MINFTQGENLMPFIAICNRVQNQDPYLTTIRLGGKKIGVEGAKNLAEALKVNHYVHSVKLGNCSIGAEGVKFLAEALKVNKTIEYLDLSGNKIRNKGLEHLVDAFSCNNTLVNIYLANNDIGLDGAKTFASAIQANATPRVISLGTNKIGYRGLEYILDALVGNTTITSLDLEHNQITVDESERNVTYITKKFLEMIRSNKTLQSLRLNGNSIKGRIIEKKYLGETDSSGDEIESEIKKESIHELLEKELANNYTLTDLHFANNIYNESTELIRQHCARNKQLVQDAINYIRACDQMSLQALLNSGVSVNGRDPATGNTLLHEAVLSQQAELVTLLLDYGCEKSFRNLRNQLPLDLAKDLNNGEILSLLVGKDEGKQEDTFGMKKLSLNDQNRALKMGKFNKKKQSVQEHKNFQWYQKLEKLEREKNIYLSESTDQIDLEETSRLATRKIAKQNSAKGKQEDTFGMEKIIAENKKLQSIIDKQNREIKELKITIKNLRKLS